MWGAIIGLFLLLWAISLSLGVVVGKLLWTPPVKGVK
mgnify:CR=1 FL=1|tara:strand:- start:326 stop:436 length:111 start_codon:yes stop_codon:yes gene_type:complete